MRQYLKRRKRGLFENAEPRTHVRPQSNTYKAQSPDTERNNGPSWSCSDIRFKCALASCSRAQQLYGRKPASMVKGTSSISSLQMQYLSTIRSPSYLYHCDTNNIIKTTNEWNSVAQTLRVTKRHAASICHCHKPYSLKLFRISFVYLRTTSRYAHMIKHLLKGNEWTMN
jgi:hypothetical protein